MKTADMTIAAALLCAGTAFAQDGRVPDPDEPVDIYEGGDLIEETDMPPPDTDTDVDVDVDVTPAPPAPAPAMAPAPAPAPAVSPAPRVDLGDGINTLFGGELKLGVGASDFTEDSAQDNTSAGLNWDVRGVFGGNFPIGLEAAYLGSSRNIDNSFANGDGDTQLVSNGVEGDVRLALPISAGELVDVRPFAFGGVGWQYMTMWGDGAVDGARDDGDHILTIPAGIGLDVGVGPLNLDLRGTYRHAVGSDLFGEAGAGFDEPDALHSYGVTGAIGVEF